MARKDSTLPSYVQVPRVISSPKPRVCSNGAELDKTWQLHKVLHPSGGQIENCIFHKRNFHLNSLESRHRPSIPVTMSPRTWNMHHEINSPRRHAVTQRTNLAANAVSRYVGTSTLNTDCCLLESGRWKYEWIFYFLFAPHGR